MSRIRRIFLAEDNPQDVELAMMSTPGGRPLRRRTFSTPYLRARSMFALTTAGMPQHCCLGTITSMPLR